MSGNQGGGILIGGLGATDVAAAAREVSARLDALELSAYVSCGSTSCAGRPSIRFCLRDEFAQIWIPGGDTTQLCEQLGLDTRERDLDLEREILLAMLASPVAFAFPTSAELFAAVRIRQNIVHAARRTAMDFHTTEVNRPDDCWVFDDDCGFTLRSGKSLIEALQKATQPDLSGRLYSFSCYRATEYVILLAIAMELEHNNPDLLHDLERFWQVRAIASGRFHEVFLREYGSMAEPLPPKYYVPGDRVWFRNPDDHSSDASGYEGSWVMYHGAGLFSNFWKRNKPFTLASKCLEVFHWRHATYTDTAGELRIDEAIVTERVAATLADERETGEILRRMFRLRDPSGVYAEGGCIDTTRECPRQVCPGTTDMVLPSLA